MALILAALLIAADQLSKAWVVTALQVGSREVHLGLGFYIVHTRNNGAAFGILRNVHLRIGALDIDGTFLLGVLSALVGLAIAAALVSSGRRLSTLTRVSLALILAGAWGNMIDRFRLGYVVDFIHFHVRGFDFPVFNVADACIVVGAVLLLLASLLAPGQPQRGAHSGHGSFEDAGRHPSRHPHDGAADPFSVEFPDLPPLSQEPTAEAGAEGARNEGY